MRLQQWSFTARLLLGLGMAAVTTAVLAWLSGAPPVAAPATPAATPAPFAMPRLTPGHESVLLLAASEAVPADAELLLQLDAVGLVRLLRQPLQLVPMPAPLLAPPVRPAIVLPVQDLAALSPRARGSLLECLGALVADRPVTPRHLGFARLRAAPAELARLLSWIR